MNYVKFRNQKLIRRGIFVALVLIATYFAGVSCKVNFADFLKGVPTGMKFLSFMFPPDLEVLQDLIKPAIDTILFAFLATVFGTFMSFFVGIAASSNLSPIWLRTFSRFLLATERALPEIIILLLLVAALGLGPFAGVVALSFGCVGMLGKLFADAIEEINPRVLESLACVGANQWQIIKYGVLPEVLPSIITNTIFRFEVNIRLSVLMGAVGAGGIGFELLHAFNILRYERATTAILVTLALVFLSERLSDFLRKKMVPDSKLK